MVSNFYKRFSKHILWLVALSFPYLAMTAESMRSNNDIETWLPKESAVRTVYERFKREFGVEEVIVIGVETEAADERLIEALASRVDQIPGIRKCWTPPRMQAVMEQLGVSEQASQERLDGLMGTRGGKLTGLVMVLNEKGLKDRPGTVDAVRQELQYCQLDGQKSCITGAPVIVTELDRLGSKKAGRNFFLLTLAITLGLLYYSIGHWGLSFSLLGITLWGIYLTQATICLCGGEMNFIMGALSIMVMIFILSVSIHFLSYYASAVEEQLPDPLGVALKQSWNPCILSTLTTLIGLVSLNVSTILPVVQFGYAAGLGSVVALIAGLGLTPAVLTVWPRCELRCSRRGHEFACWGNLVLRRKKSLLAGMLGVMFLTSFGLLNLRSEIDPIKFLPSDSKVLTDLRRVERDLTNIDSIEAVVDFGDQRLPFVERLAVVRDLEARLGSHPAVRHTISLASFFPQEMPENPFAVMSLLKQAQTHNGENEYLAQGDRLWRISARIDGTKARTHKDVFADFEKLTAGAPIHFTGITPLLENAQNEIFTGFWQSFTVAFVIISVVMIISLWSFKAGMIAMVPNIVPIWLVFGSVGFLGMNVDIGMMMTGSIALGISVDCTFHFMVRYREQYNLGKSSEEAVLSALEHTGEPMLDSALVSSLGMLALGLSNFSPTARFGYLMAAQMVASLLGELVMLPVLLCLLTGRRGKQGSSNTLTAGSSELQGPHQVRSAVVERVA
jgi:predicted RND superfamily exporter protein